MTDTLSFVQYLDEQLSSNKNSDRCLVCCADSDSQSVFNAIFLLGSYMIIMMDENVDIVAKHFDTLLQNLLEVKHEMHKSYKRGFAVVKDCWLGLYRGKKCRWIQQPEHVGSPFWGNFDVELYEHYGNPLNADMHEVVPGKLIAFEGPQDLGGVLLYKDENCKRRFAPEHYVDLFHSFGAATVIRLNEPEYDAHAFKDAGIAHHDLSFEDSVAPSARVVAAFLRIAEAAQGKIAVHCKAGLGRTGTLVALYMMKHHGFAAREAIGWLRVVRPGIVAGSHLRFLSYVQRLRRAEQPMGPGPAKPSGSTSLLQCSHPSSPLSGAAAVGACRRATVSSATTRGAAAAASASASVGSAEGGRASSTMEEQAAAPADRGEGWRLWIAEVAAAGAVAISLHLALRLATGTL